MSTCPDVLCTLRNGNGYCSQTACVRNKQIIPIENKMPHKISEFICLECKKRWIAVRPDRTLLKDIECPNGHIGYAIETGEDIDDEAD